MTIKEIAALSGVSVSTVSKIVNGKDQSINPETRKRVLKIVKEYHYTPYGMAKKISSSKSFVLAVLLCSSGKANQMLSGIIQAAQTRGYGILVFDSQYDPEMELKQITSICQKNVDGILWEPVNSQSPSHAHYFEERNIPVCYMNGPAELPSCRIDFTQMGYALTQKLISYKHNRIGCLMKPYNRRSELVLEGYRKCLYDHQIPYDEELALFSDHPDCTLKILTHNITGIISSHFAATLALFKQLNELHYSIPADLSLVSLKNDLKNAASFPHISGIMIPYQEFGDFLCNKLIDLCEKKEGEENPVIFSPTLEFSCETSITAPPMLRAKKIAVVGSINIDNTFNVDLLPQAGKTTRIQNSTVMLGGKGANQAIGASRLGREVILIGKIGNDIDSTIAVNALTNEKLSTHGIFRDMNAQTGKAYIYIENNGESTITILAGANANLSCEQIQRRRHLFENAGYCLLSTEIPMPTILEAARIGKNCGAKNIIKPAALKHLPQELLPYIDILVPNRKEAVTLCPENLCIEEQADYFYHLGIPVVIITLGHEGCYLRTSDTARFFPAVRILPVDTTGGADAFISALASYLTEGYPLENAIQIATYAAAFCVSRQGVVSALVDKNTLESFIRRKQPDLLKLP